MRCTPGCPSGQRERTVNPPALPSKVRILYLAQNEPPGEWRHSPGGFLVPGAPVSASPLLRPVRARPSRPRETGGATLEVGRTNLQGCSVPGTLWRSSGRCWGGAVDGEERGDWRPCAAEVAEPQVHGVRFIAGDLWICAREATLVILLQASGAGAGTTEVVYRFRCMRYAPLAQSAERFHGKEKVDSSILSGGSSHFEAISGMPVTAG